MKIFADKNILELENYFSRHGELHLFDGRELKQADLVTADALLVRSITPVDKALLQGTQVKFVATATSGTDHIDLKYLKQAGIGFSDAKGSNANAVVDYCFTALAYAVKSKGFALSESRVGIVGAGAVGSCFARKLSAMSVEVICYDPLVDTAASPLKFSPLQDVLSCDVISLHVPLSKQGAYPSYKLIGARELAAMHADAMLINTCRGGVVDETALKNFLAENAEFTAVFDVWKDEPNIDGQLLNSVSIATPHIAGYSIEAKSNATRLLAEAFAAFYQLDMEAGVNAPRQEFDLSLENKTAQGDEWSTLLATFPLLELSQSFKQAINAGSGEPASGAKAFDSLRQQLLSRKEFQSTRLNIANYSKAQQKFLSILGFQLR